ncbi:hypothetical protein M378DRAFT_759265 [Amanita muscaria Koide BX008]|uniref:Uncharacterized protein n=1 Tax=Amanita muscaria (strain Koide BX008) TaxID=946122 RepID=A0A0C2SKV7_AMAMK|nr:hypothetical protein M378DRAFT_759265 [Amanita muscaria Koide BX008]
MAYLSPDTVNNQELRQCLIFSFHPLLLICRKPNAIILPATNARTKCKAPATDESI